LDRGVETGENFRIFRLAAPGFSEASRRLNDELGITRLALHRLMDERLCPQLAALGEPGGTRVETPPTSEPNNATVA
jgi:hypothetical protein